MKNNTLCGVLVALGIAAGSGVAQAAPEIHDGFQFRGAVGPGYLSDSLKLDPGGATGSVKGGAFDLQLYFGGTLSPGLALGGMLDVAIAPGPKYTLDGLGSGTASSDVSLNYAYIGPYVDFYPDPHEGLHVLGTVGFADMNVSNKNSSSNSSSGFGLGAGIGYDFWVASEWSLGILGRFTYAHMSYEDHGLKETDNVILPALLFSATYQ